MVKIDGEWLLTYFQQELGLGLADAYRLYLYLKEWDGDYSGMVSKFGKYPPESSIPAIMYALAVVHPTGILEMGRATHHLTLYYGVERSSPVIFHLFRPGTINKEFLASVRGEPRDPNEPRESDRSGFLGKFLSKLASKLEEIPDRDFERYQAKEARRLNMSLDEYLINGPHTRHKKCLLLYLRMCALAGVHDMSLAVGEGAGYKDLRDEILDILEVSIHRPPWNDVCEEGLHYSEIREISQDVFRNKYSYYWGSDCFELIGKGGRT